MQTSCDTIDRSRADGGIAVRKTTPYVVGIGGTTRPGSSTETALRCSLRAAEAAGATTRLFSGDRLAELPHYAPENPERSDLAVELIEEIRKADGLILASPGYHGGISGLVKNALDYTEDMANDERIYLSGMPVGVIATGAGWQGVIAAIAALRAVVHALRGWPTPLGAGVRTIGRVFDENGDCLDDAAAFQLRTVGEDVVSFLRR